MWPTSIVDPFTNFSKRRRHFLAGLVVDPEAAADLSIAASKVVEVHHAAEMEPLLLVEKPPNKSRRRSVCINNNFE